MTILTDIDSLGDGPNATTSITLANSVIALHTGATTRLSVAANGQIVLGANATVSSLFYINGSSASPLTPASASSGTITLDFSTANNFTLALSAAATLAAPINATAGQSGVIFIVQPAGGNATLGYNGATWKWPNGAVPTASTAAGAVDSIVYVVRSGGATPVIAAQFVSNFS